MLGPTSSSVPQWSTLQLHQMDHGKVKSGCKVMRVCCMKAWIWAPWYGNMLATHKVGRMIERNMALFFFFIIITFYLAALQQSLQYYVLQSKNVTIYLAHPRIRWFLDKEQLPHATQQTELSQWENKLFFIFFSSYGGMSWILAWIYFFCFIS